MDLDIRRHIINNFKGDNIETLRSAIDESIKENDEITLPGMGVFLEIIWSDATDEMKNEMLKIIESRIKIDDTLENDNTSSNQSKNDDNN